MLENLQFVEHKRNFLETLHYVTIINTYALRKKKNKQREVSNKKYYVSSICLFLKLFIGSKVS